MVFTVDHLDQLAYYDVGRAGRKWWKYIMFGLFNFAIVNAYVLKCLANKPLPSNHRQWSLKAFKVALVHQLCDGFSSRKRASMSSAHEVQDVIERDVIPGHDIVRFLGRRKACQACLASNRRTPANRCVVSVYAGVDLGGIPLSRAPQILRRNTRFASTVIRPDYQLLPRFGDPILGLASLD